MEALGEKHGIVVASVRLVLKRRLLAAANRGVPSLGAFLRRFLNDDMVVYGQVCSTPEQASALD